jgi:hypothetical protein
MSLPYFPACTGSVVSAIRLSCWSKDARCPEYVARVELGALLHQGLLQHETLRRLSRAWCRSQRWTRRVVVAWSAWYLDLDLAVAVDLPEWLTSLSKAEQKHFKSSTSGRGTTEERQGLPSNRAEQKQSKSRAKAPRARSLPKEVEGEGDTPHTPQGVEVEVYKAWRVYHPRSAPTPSKLARKHARRIVEECEGVEGALILIRWAHVSLDRWAQQLRGEAPWPDGDLITRLDLQSLGRSVTSRIAQAQAWSDRGEATRIASTRPGKASKLDIAADASALFGQMMNGAPEAPDAPDSVFSHPVAP